MEYVMLSYARYAVFAVVVFLCLQNNSKADAAGPKAQPQAAAPVATEPSGINTDSDAENNFAEEQHYQSIIKDYQRYLTTIPTNIRSEITNYRINIAELNRKKRQLYKALSQESQGYLKREQEYKKKLPLIHRSKIKLKKTLQRLLGIKNN